jgi:hypothetical protein
MTLCDSGWLFVCGLVSFCNPSYIVYILYIKTLNLQSGGGGAILLKIDLPPLSISPRFKRGLYHLSQVIQTYRKLFIPLPLFIFMQAL